MAAPKLRYPERSQISMFWGAVDDLVPHDHPVRFVWSFVEKLDLSAFLQKIRSLHGEAGASAYDPHVLLAVWIWATLQAEGSAREIPRLCTEHVTYRWLCGGLRPNYHTLSNFRTSNLEELENLLSDSIAVLLIEKVVTMQCVTQDGMRVRASAGSSSFRRKQTLETLREQARLQVQQLREELESGSASLSERRSAARTRAAREKQERIERALQEFKEIEKKDAPAKEAKEAPDAPGADGQAPSSKTSGGKKKPEPRASTTDPEARVMKMADGGFRPAYNCQFATDRDSGLVLAVDVVNAGSDSGQMSRMLEKLEKTYGRRPGEYLVDHAYVQSHEELVKAGQGGTVVYGPPKEARPAPKKKSKYWEEKKPQEVREFERRMEQEEGKAKLRQRGEVAEWVHALARNRGLRQFLVRGERKVRAVAVLHALTHNIQCLLRLQWLGRMA